MEKEFVDCILFPYQSEWYLLPTITIAEIAPLEKCKKINIPPFCIGTVLWRELNIPLLALRLSSVTQNKSLHKIAVVNALFADNSLTPPYFAFIFDGKAKKIKVKQQDVTWIDEKKRKIRLSQDNGILENVIIPDIQGLSNEVIGLLDKLTSPNNS